MKIYYKGKTKDIYELENGNYLLKFKDDVTGVDGVFDPGANQVGLTIDGIGKEDLKLSKYFFELFEASGIKTHYCNSSIDENTMEVKKASVFGSGIELICRFKAVGSFMRRYGKYAKEEQDLNGYVEVTLKDDERNDPLITKDALILLNILTEEEYEELVKMTYTISNIIKEELSKNELDLYDIKLEFGRLENDSEIVLIDEVSGGNMRVYKNGEYVEPMQLAKLMKI